MLLRIGPHFELEFDFSFHACFIRVGTWERFYNRLGYPVK